MKDRDNIVTLSLRLASLIIFKFKYRNLIYLAALIFPEYLLISLAPVTLAEEVTS
jgi:hypothetical protein